MSNSLWSHEQRYSRLSYLSLSPGVCSNSWPLSQWCHPTISSSVSPFSSFPQSLPAPGSFPMSGLFVLCGQSIGVLASGSLSNEYSRFIPFRIDWLDLLAVQGSLKSLLKDHSLKILILFLRAFFVIQLSHLYMTTGNTIALTIWTFVNKWCLSFFKCCLDLSLEKTVAPYSSILAWKIPWIEEPGKLQSMVLQRVGWDWAISRSLFFLWLISLNIILISSRSIQVVTYNKISFFF